MMETSTPYVFFWKADGIFGEFSQWYKSSFTCNDRFFETAEQFMMYGKAETFGDTEMASTILNSPDAHPSVHRKMGRSVSNFNETTWNSESMRIVVIGNLCKFDQNQRLKDILLSTGNKMLVESSPTDRVWGIGFSDADAVANISRWGDNKLGKALMIVRAIISYRTRRSIMTMFMDASQLNEVDMNVAMEEYEAMDPIATIHSTRATIATTQTETNTNMAVNTIEELFTDLIMTNPMDELTNVFGASSVSTNEYPMSDLEICLVRTKATINQLNTIMDMGWVIISSWIEDESVSKSWDNTVTDVSFRLAKGNTRVILITDVPLALGRDVVINLDSDDPGSSPEIITNMRQSIQKLRAVSISGYSPLAPRGLGMTTVSKVPKLSVMGLDIEVSTVERKGGMPLPHDPIISIVVSNGGWYDKEFEDKCYCLYAFGKCREIKWPDGRNAYVAKVSGNEEAVRETFKIVNMLSPDFVNVHNGFNFDLRCLAASSALDPTIGPTFSERRLGNVGVGIFWRLDNGTMVVDSMYTAATEPTSNWPSLALAKMSEKFDLPPKMDSGTMSIKVSEMADVTDIIEYNARDADLHVWLPKNMLMCERLCTLAGVARSTMWDAIANNTAVMMFCLQQSEALKRGMILDLSRNTTVTDDAKYEGGFVVTPMPGCYQGVAMLDGNSLYGSLMKHLQIYVDRCISAPTIEALRKKTPVDLPDNVEMVEEKKVVWNKEVIVMRTKRTYISVLQGEETLLGEMIGMLIDLRSNARKEASKYPTNSIDWRRWTVLGQCYKLLLVSVYGATGGKHSILSSRVCAEAITCAARYYVKNMIRVSEEGGCAVVYGDTDSIFPWVGGKTKEECDTAGLRLKKLIDESLVDTPFENVKADMKGNYKHMLITSRKKYSTVDWDGVVETKGMSPVKRDTIPIAKYVTTKVLAIINTSNSYEVKKKSVTEFLGKVITAINNGKIPVTMQMFETKINCQPHYKYKSANGGYVSVLVDSGEKVTNVDKKWVLERVNGAVATILEAAEMGSFQSLLFSYNMMVKKKRVAGMSRS